MEDMEFPRPSKPKNNFLFRKEHDPNDNKLSKSAIMFFKILHLLLALDFGFFQHKTLAHKVIFKIGILCQLLTCSILYFVNIAFDNYNVHLRVGLTPSLIQYIVYVI